MVVDTKLYKTLGVDPGADANTIKKAYREAERKFKGNYFYSVLAGYNF